MKLSELAQLLTATIKARKPVLVVGPPGVGKSATIGAVAQAVDADLIITHPGIEDPTDAKGLPFVVEGAAEFLPFGALRRARDARKLTVWFADDFGQATPAVQAAYMPLMDSVRGHNALLGEGAQHIVFVAATNRRTDKAGVSGILEPVKSRFHSIVTLEPDTDDFCAWAIDHNIHPLVVAFPRFRPDLLSHFEATADLSNSPMPRTWAHVSDLLSLDLPPAILAQAIRGAVGEGAAVEFLAFMRLYQELPSVDQIVLDPDSVPVPTKPATRYALVSAMASKTTPTNFPRFTRYAERLVDAMAGEFAVLYLRDVLRRDASLAKTAAYIKLVTGDMAELVSGVKK